MTNQAKFKLRMYVDKFLDKVMIVAKRQHLSYEELERQITGWLLQVRLDLILVAKCFSPISFINSLNMVWIMSISGLLTFDVYTFD